MCEEKQVGKFMNITRRVFLKTTATGIALATTQGWAGKLPSPVIERRDLYPQGVASGDPTANSVILWTRRPPIKGQSANRLVVEIATDPEFNQLFAGGTARISSDADWT
jgi:alkaline phosphatase D